MTLEEMAQKIQAKFRPYDPILTSDGKPCGGEAYVNENGELVIVIAKIRPLALDLDKYIRVTMTFKQEDNGELTLVSRKSHPSLSMATPGIYVGDSYTFGRIVRPFS